MQRLFAVLLMSATVVAASGCASRKYVRNTVNDSENKLSARIDANEGDIKELRDDVDRKVSGVENEVSALDARTTSGMNSLKSDVQSADQHASTADQHASQAQSAADRAAHGVNSLNERFENRNQFSVSDEKSIQFQFDSAMLDERYMGMLDDIASSLAQNPDAILVLAGRTDSAGSKDYNVKLGQRRVDAVKHYLVVEKGVPVYKIHEISFGAEKPVAANATREGREKNRAVVMSVMVPVSEGAVASKN